MWVGVRALPAGEAGLGMRSQQLPPSTFASYRHRGIATQSFSGESGLFIIVREML
jgi:hypothetical protein